MLPSFLPDSNFMIGSFLFVTSFFFAALREEGKKIDVQPLSREKGRTGKPGNQLVMLIEKDRLKRNCEMFVPQGPSPSH